MAHPDPVLAALDEAVTAALADAGLPAGDAELERPADPDHGDWASTVALRLASEVGRTPRELAEELVALLDAPDEVAEVSVAGPGFVNFRLAPAYFAGVVRRVVARGEAFGRRSPADGSRELVNVEFVSANPTGPLHVGHGRWAATGDAIAALIEAAGDAVHREYYLNDAGEQVRRLGESVVLVARGEELTDDHYRGDYVRGIADELRGELGDGAVTGGDRGDGPAGAAPDLGRGGSGAGDGDPRVAPGLAAKVGELAVGRVRDRIGVVLNDMGVVYDTWFSERTLHDSGAVEDTIAALTGAGHTYEQDGALFLATAEHGDDKDRVLVRSDGRPTYLAADCAYLRDKWERADRLFYLLGADHHGYVARLRAAAACLGIPPERVEIAIGQMVNLLRGGEPMKMSTRAGRFVTLEEVVGEVGVDVTRYHFLRQSLDTPLDFDLTAVAEQSMDNPVYYVQYAHARISSLIRTADERVFEAGDVADAALELLADPPERELLRALPRLPEVVSEAAELRATQRLARYAEELAGSFHRFYAECRVLGLDEEAGGQRRGRARYWLAVAARQVLANALGLLRVSAPDRM